MMTICMIASMGRASPEMQEIARVMKSMADICQMMMQKEMALRRYWITAMISVGRLLLIVLVLEVQWIRFWDLRIKTERKKLE